MSEEVAEEIIRRILSEREDLTREQLERLVEDKRAKYGKVLTREGALYLIASELGVPFLDSHNTFDAVKIGDLIPGLRKISTSGVVKRVGALTEFAKRDGSKGRRLWVLLSDESGEVNVILWNEAASKALNQGLGSGSLIKLRGVSTKRGLSGKVEVHVNSAESLEVLQPREEVASQAHIEVILLRKAKLKQFVGRSGEGRVLSAYVFDGESEKRVVFWNEKADFADQLQRGYVLRLRGYRVRRGISGEEEYHIDEDSEVEVVGEADVREAVKIAPISQIVKSEGLSPSTYTVFGRVISITGVRETRGGRMSTITLADETGAIDLVLWREQTGFVSSVELGDALLVEGAVAKAMRRGLVLQVRQDSLIDINPSYLPPPPSLESLAKKPREIEPGERHVIVSGRVVDVKEEVSGDIVVSVEEDGDLISVVAWGERVEQLRKLEVGSRVVLLNLWAREVEGGGVELVFTDQSAWVLADKRA